MANQEAEDLKEWGFPILYIFSRFMMYLYFFPAEIGAHGDVMQYYYAWSNLKGWPFIHYWIEYPPIFPFLLAFLSRMINGSSYLFYFIITFLFAVTGAGVLIMFRRLAEQLYPAEEAFQRTLILFGLLMVFPYTWSYYDTLPLLIMLIALHSLLNQHQTRTGLIIGLGMLTKWFPGFLLAAIWRFRSPKKAMGITALALGLVVAVLGVLYLFSPQYTAASLLVQPGRNSWQTLWAMIDGNTDTGNIVQLEDHYYPEVVTRLPGLPARIPTWASLIFFGGLGFAAFLMVKNHGNRSLVAFFSLTWAIFLLWSPGWSPQWVLYLLPLILLTLPLKSGLMACLGLLFFTVLEWPFLFTLHLNGGLWITTGARALIFAWLGLRWFRMTREPETENELELIGYPQSYTP